MEGDPKPISTRSCDLRGTLRALRGLVGSQLGIEVAPHARAAPVLTLTARLDRAYAIGHPRRPAIAFDVADATFRISTTTFLTATRETYADPESGLHWRLLAIELRDGMIIEVEEIPAGPEGRG